MSFDAHDEESLLFKLRFRNPDGLRLSLFDRCGRSGDDAARVCEIHGVKGCEECFVPAKPPASAFFPTLPPPGDRPPVSEHVWRPNDLFDDDLNIRVVDADAEPPIEGAKRSRTGVLTIEVGDCDWTLYEAVKAGKESLRKFCHLLVRDLAPFLLDTQFKRPLYFEEARRHRTTEENAAVAPVMIPIFAVTEVESRFYRDYASNNRTRDQLKATYGRWPKEKDFIDLEGRILRHAFKVGLIILPKVRRVQSGSTLAMTWTEEQIADLFAVDPDSRDPCGSGFIRTKDPKNMAVYRDDISQERALRDWIKKQE